MLNYEGMTRIKKWYWALRIKCLKCWKLWASSLSINTNADAVHKCSHKNLNINVMCAMLPPMLFISVSISVLILSLSLHWSLGLCFFVFLFYPIFYRIIIIISVAIMWRKYVLAIYMHYIVNGFNCCFCIHIKKCIEFTNLSILQT